jgi:predicted nucleotidyltransferase
MGIHVQQVILFGSHARGEAHEDSDIDLLIVSSDFASLPDLEGRRLLSRARLSLWQPIHAYPATSEELEHVEPATFLEEILETGVRVA